MKRTATSPRAQCPTDSSSKADFQPYRVWGFFPFSQQDAKPWKCLACFCNPAAATEFAMECMERRPTFLQTPN